MNDVTRREFTGLVLGALGAAGARRASGGDPGAGGGGEPPSRPPLPSVRWKGHEISRLLVGHNPIKGMSHTSAALNQEMREWFAADAARGVRLLRRCEEAGITACQMGFRPDELFIESMLQAHYRSGGTLKWIASFYSMPQDREAGKRELARILSMVPRPIGVQQIGNTSDLLARRGEPDRALENLKMFRDAGLLVGLGSHNHELVDRAESKGWDLDFYQASFYRSAFSLDPARSGREIFEDDDRRAMIRTIRQVAKPCIAFKVLGAGRHCASREAVEAALRLAFESIKPTDVVLLGMWLKHKDQVAEDTALVARICGGGR